MTKLNKGYVSELEDCLLVCRLWHDFLSTHLFKRWAERMVSRDEAMVELATAEGWIKFLNIPAEQVGKTYC